MLSTLLAISWEPEIRGVIVVLIGVVTLMGSVYLILGTNVGARLGLLIALAGLFGWMATMGAIWWTYGIGLKGREAPWKPAAPISIVRDARLLDKAGVRQEFTGRVQGNQMTGTVRTNGQEAPFTATKK